MNRAVIHALVLLSAGTVPGCLLYTDPVNDTPRMQGIRRPDELHIGEQPQLTAEVIDDQPDYRLEWVVKEGPCPDVPRPIWPEDGIPVQTTSLRPDARTDLSPVCVWARATDRYGAVADPPAMAELAASNRPPAAEVLVVLPIQPWADNSYRLLTDFRLSGAMSSDPDPQDSSKLQFQWTLISAPSTYTDNGGDCPDAPAGDHSQHCFTATDAGTYRIRLVVNDGHADSAPKEFWANVLPDQDPWLRDTQPTTSTQLVLGVGEARSLQVTWVEDELDPFPAGTNGVASFRWWMRQPDSQTPTWQAIPGNWSQLDIPAYTFDSGDVELCVQCFDRRTSLMSMSPESCNSVQLATKPAAAVWKLSYR